MKNWKRLFALLLSLVMALSLFACKAGDDPGETASPNPNVTSGDSSEPPEVSLDPDPAPSIEVDLTQDAMTFAAGISPDEDLLTVNGDPVKANLVLYWLALSCNNFMSSYGMFGLQLTDPVGEDSDETFADQVRESAVTIAVYNTLLQQKAAELGCLPTDAQVQEAKDKMLADGEDNYETMKTAYGLSDASMEYLYLSNSYYDNVLDLLYPTATDEMLNNYAYQAKHILIGTLDENRNPLPDDQKAEKLKQAEDILAQLQAASDLEAKFDELMNEFSEDGRDDDGNLNAPDGYDTSRGKMVTEFEEAALALKPGEMSGIVESQFGYHIILRGEMSEEDLQSYAEDCRQYYLDEDLDDLRDAADISTAAALDELDVASFFDRYSAYLTAVIEQNTPADEGGDDTSGDGGDAAG